MPTSGIFQLSTLEALCAGLIIGTGLALLCAALYGLPPREPDERPRGEQISDAIKFLTTRGAIASVVGVLILAVTRWPVAAIASGLLVFFWNRLFGGLGAERASLARVEALAAWTESLRDTIAGAVGLEQAIPATARAASPAIRQHLELLVDRLRARMPLPQALEHLADDMNDASADLVIAALMLNARLRGPGLRDVLGALAKASREEVDMRQRVMAQRSSTRRSVQIVVGVTVIMVLALAVFNKSFVQPYSTVTGQLVLVGVIALFAAGFAWLRKLSDVETPARFLHRMNLGQGPGAPGQPGQGPGLPGVPGAAGMPGQVPGQRGVETR